MTQYDVIDQAETAGGRVEILAYPDLAGSDSARTAEQLYFMKRAGVRAKTVRLTLNSGQCTLEPGALYHMQGNLDFKTSTGGGLGRGLLRSAFSGETLFVNTITGTGVVYLEPTWGHFAILNLEKDAPAVIIEKGMFCAAVGDIDVSASVVASAAGLIGGEGLVQTKVSGQGVVIMNLPVPWEEVEMFDITESGKLYLDGTFQVMRTEDVDFKIEKSSKSWMSTAVSGEGLLQTFGGSGLVWAAHTLPIYQGLKMQDLMGLSGLAGARGDTSG